MGKTATVEETALAQCIKETAELQTASSTENARARVESAIVIAKRFPRNEEGVYQQLIKSCKRPGFAEAAMYSFPRGKGEKRVDVKGPSAPFARELARMWGNIEHGVQIVHDDDSTRTIRAEVWDKQTNANAFAEDSFGKRIQRWVDGKLTWIPADERELRELTNRRAAILIRNCILALVPKDFVDDAMETVDSTLENAASEDPDAAKKRLLVGFGELNISAEMLETYLDHKIDQTTPKELAELRRIYVSIKDGQSTWTEYGGGRVIEKPTASPPVIETKGKVVGTSAAKAEPEPAKTEKPPAKEAVEIPKASEPPEVVEDIFVDILSKIMNDTKHYRFVTKANGEFHSTNEAAKVVVKEALTSKATCRISYRQDGEKRRLVGVETL